jgi:hypothetical protein
MSTAIQELQEKKKYLVVCIEYLEATIEKYKFNEGELEESYCKEQIDFIDHSIAGYRTELHQIESELAVLSNSHDN